MLIHFGNSDAKSLALDTLLAARCEAKGVSKKQRDEEKGILTDVGRHRSQRPGGGAEEGRGASSVRLEPSAFLDDVEGLERGDTAVARDDHCHVRGDRAEESRDGEEAGDSDELNNCRRLFPAVAREVAYMDSSRKPRG